MEAEKRMQYFWMFCIPLRTVIAIFATLATLQENKILFYVVGSYTAFTATVFFLNVLRTLQGIKKKGFFGGDMWWKNARYIHISIYLLCSILSFLQTYGSGVVLFVDVQFAISLGILHYRYNIEL